MANVFISHRKNDSTKAEQLANELSAAGHEVWFDEWQINLGDSIIDKINEGLETSNYLLVCYSSSTVNSSWMSREWMSALACQLEGKGVIVIPVYLTGKTAPAIMADIKAADLMTNWSKGIAALLKVLQ